MDTTKRIVISGYYGFDNAGDEAILYSIIQALKKQFTKNKLQIVVLSNNPAKTKRRYKVGSVNRWNIKDIYGVIKECDLLISGGGSLLQDVTSNKTVPYYLAIIKMAQMLDKEIVFYSQGYGPVNKMHNKYMVKKVLNNVNHIYVRDKDSKTRLIEAGVTSDIKLSADPVIGMKINNPADILGKFRNDSAKLKVGICLRPWEDDEEVQEKVLEICKELESRNIEVFFIPMHYPDDKELLEDMDVGTLNAQKVLYELTVEETFSLIGQMDIIVAMRLHSLIIAIAQEVPVVALSYDPKVDSLMDNINPQHCYDVGDFNSSDVLESILSQVKDLDKEKMNMKSKKELLLKKVYGPAKQIKKILS